jgi:hypothetical protein
MGNYEIAVLAGWAVAVWAFCSVLFSDSAKFSNLGRSKRRWFLIELTAFIPYFGFIAVLCYAFMVRVHFPPRPERPSRPRPAPTSSSTGGRTSGPVKPPSSYTPPQRQKCGSCGGSGSRPCSCYGGWVAAGSNQTHSACMGRGQVTCQMCCGSGYR